MALRARIIRAGSDNSGSVPQFSRFLLGPEPKNLGLFEHAGITPIRKSTKRRGVYRKCRAGSRAIEASSCASIIHKQQAISGVARIYSRASTAGQFGGVKRADNWSRGFRT